MVQGLLAIDQETLRNYFGPDMVQGLLAIDRETSRNCFGTDVLPGLLGIDRETLRNYFGLDNIGHARDREHLGIEQNSRSIVFAYPLERVLGGTKKNADL